MCVYYACTAGVRGLYSGAVTSFVSCLSSLYCCLASSKSRSNKNNDIVLWRFSTLSVLARLFFFSLSLLLIYVFSTSYFPPSLSACFIWVVVRIYTPSPSFLMELKSLESRTRDYYPYAPCDCIVKLFIITINIIIIIITIRKYTILIVYPRFQTFFSPPFCLSFFFSVEEK